MSDVFISYSRDDKTFARQLFDTLKNEDRDIWADWEDIPFSVDWWEEICRGIDRANVMLFLISPDSLGSMVCNRELAYARENHKRIIPVMRREVEETWLAEAWNEHEWKNQAEENWTAVKHLNWLYFREQDDFDAAFENLMATIEQDPEHVRYHTRMLVLSREWQASKDKGLPLRGEDLRQAENWLLFNASKDPKPTQLQQDYINASIALRQREARRTRYIILSLTAMLLVVFFAAIVAFNQRNEAQNQAATATFALGREDVARQNAEREAVVSQSLAISSSAALLDAEDHLLALNLARESALIADPPALVWRILADLAYRPGLKKIYETIPTEIPGFNLDELTPETASESVGNPLAETSPDGQWRFYLDYSTLVIVDAAGEIVHEIPTRHSYITTAHFTNDSRQIWTMGIDSDLVQWDVATGAEAYRFNVPIISMGTSALSDDLRYVAMGTNGDFVLSSDSIAVLDTYLFKTYSQEFGSVVTGVSAIAINSQEDVVYFGTYDGTFWAWDFANGGAPFRIGWMPSAINKILLSDDGTQALTTVSEGSLLYEWDVRLRADKEAQVIVITPVVDIFMSPADDFVGLSSGGSIAQVDLAHKDGQWTLEEVDDHLLGRTFAYSTTGTRLRGTCLETVDFECVQGIVEILDANDALVAMYDQLSSQPSAAAFSDDGSMVAVGTEDGSTIIWTPATAEIRALPAMFSEVSAIAFHPDGTMIFVGDENGLVRGLDLAGNEKIAVIAMGGRVSEIVVNDKLKHAYIASDLDKIARVDLSTGQLAGTLSGHRGAITGLALVPDGKYLLSSSMDGTFILWDLEMGEAIRQVPAHKRGVLDIVVTSDGQYAVTSGNLLVSDMGASLNAVTMWRIDLPEALLQWIDSNRILPELTCVQRQAYRLEGECEVIETSLTPSSE